MVFANNSGSGFPGGFPEAGIFFKSNAYDFRLHNYVFSFKLKLSPNEKFIFSSNVGSKITRHHETIFLSYSACKSAFVQFG